MCLVCRSLREQPDQGIHVRRGDEELLLDEQAERRLMGCLPSKLSQLPPHAFPLVLTYNKLLSMIDAQLTHPFLPNQNSGNQCHPTLDDAEIEEEFGGRMVTKVDTGNIPGAGGEGSLRVVGGKRGERARTRSNRGRGWGT